MRIIYKYLQIISLEVNMSNKNQKINCDVFDCKHCNCDDCLCELEKIRVCNCNYNCDKESTMCDSYDKRD